MAYLLGGFNPRYLFYLLDFWCSLSCVWCSINYLHIKSVCYFQLIFNSTTICFFLLVNFKYFLNSKTYPSKIHCMCMEFKQECQLNTLTVSNTYAVLLLLLTHSSCMYQNEMFNFISTWSILLVNEVGIFIEVDLWNIHTIICYV